MPIDRKTKQALIGESIIFDALTDSGPNVLDVEGVSNFIDIVSLDTLGGSPVIPTFGSYKIYVKTSPQGGFKILSHNGSLKAEKTGGSALADGLAEGADFSGTPLAIKVVPIDVNVAVAYRVDIAQIL